MSIRRFGLNTIYQICGQAVPILIGVVTVPILIRTLGREQFGIYSIVLFTTGFLLLLDLGAGRAVARFASLEIRDGDLRQLSATLIISSIFLIIFSVVFVSIAIGFLPFLTANWFNVPPSDGIILMRCLFVLLIATPITILTSVARAFLEAHEKFALINIMTSVFGAASYLLPMAVALETHDVFLCALMFVAVGISRLGAFVAMAGLLYRPFVAPPRWERSHFFRYAHFLGWLSAANVLGTLIVYADRFIASGLVHVQQLPYYTVPLDFISRSLIVAGSLSGVLLPFFSKRLGLTEYGAVIERIYIVMAAIMSPVFLILLVVLPPLIGLWLGQDFRIHSTVLGGYFVVGCAISSFNVVLMSKVMADGHSDRLALLYCAELFVYCVMLVFAGRNYGLAGLAMTWAARTALEYVAFVWIIFSDPQCRRRSLAYVAVIVLPISFLLMVFIAHIGNELLRCAAGGGGILVEFLLLWFGAASPEMREDAAQTFRLLISRRPESRSA